MPDPLSIALLTYSTKPRGSVIHTLELAEALHRRGHAVTVYALDKDGQGFERPLPCAVVLIPARPAPSDTDRLIQQRIQEFVDFLSEGSGAHHDIYHAQDCLSANALTLLRQQGPWTVSCIVRTVHHIEDYSSPYLRACQDRSIREADLCLCVSDYWQQQLQAQYGIEASRVTNGVSADRFRTPVSPAQVNALKQRLGLGLGLGLDQNAPIYLTLGGIEPRKNSLRLLRAFAQVRRTFPRAQWAIAGGATVFDYHSYRDEFFAEAERLGLPLGDALIVTGVIPDTDLPALYQAADAFVLPSLKEGWGLVILEAIAAGLPVITSDQPPFTEFLNRDQALWVDPQSEAAIAQAMVQITDGAIAQALVHRSQPVLDTYTWDASAQLHERHYRTWLTTHPSAHPTPGSMLHA